MTEENNPYAPELAETMRAMLALLSQEDRYEVLGVLTEAFCIHCGREHGANRCQCWNDD